MKEIIFSLTRFRSLFKKAAGVFYKMIFVIICVFFLSTLLTCSKDDNKEQNSSGKSEASFNATFTEKTVYFTATEADKDVLSIDEDKNIFSFKNSNEKAKGLKKGDVILIHGKALAKANKVTEQGNAIVVETEEATLDEAIEDGTIQWSTYCDFQPEMELRVAMGDQLYYPRRAAAGKTVQFDFDYGGYNYLIEMDMNKEYANVIIEVTKKVVKGVKLKYAVEGRISALNAGAKIEYKKSKLKNFTQTNNNIEGELTLSATLAGSGNDALNLTLPVVLAAYPLMVGPIPTVITLKLQVVVNSVVPLDGSAKLETKFKYSSTTGIKYDGTDLKGTGKIGPYSIDKKEIDTGASSAIGVNFGIGFPRIEVGIFGKVVVPWIQTAFLIGGDFTFFPACRTAQASFIGACGYDLSFLGFKKSDKITFWEEKKEFLRTGDCK